MGHDPRYRLRVCVHVDIDSVLIAKVRTVVQIKDEELDGVEDGEDAHHEAGSLVVHRICVLPQHLLQGEKGDTE